MHNEERSSRLALYIHLLSFPVVSCLIFEMQRGLVEKRSTTLDCIRLKLNSSVLCLVYVLQCKLVTNLSLKSLLIGNVSIKLQAINEDLQCDRLVKYMQQSEVSLCSNFKSLCKCKHSPVSGRFDTLL